MNEVVKYHSKMNEVAFSKFTEQELNLFFMLCQQLKEKGSREIQLSFEQIRELVKYKFTGNDRLVKDLDRTYSKMLGLNIKLENEKEIIRFNIFTDYRISKEKKEITIRTHEYFEFILNSLDTFFTRFELNEFINIRSTYSKNMYRLLKQFRTTGYYKITVEEFRRLLDIPKNYRMSEIDKKVLMHIKKELPNYFKKLEIKKIKKQGKREIQFFEFTFEKEKIKSKKNIVEEITLL